MCAYQATRQELQPHKMHLALHHPQPPSPTTLLNAPTAPLTDTQTSDMWRRAPTQPHTGTGTVESITLYCFGAMEHAGTSAGIQNPIF